MSISPGKLRGLIRISDSTGRFKMLALDQRGSLEKMIKSVKEKAEPADLIKVKKAIIKSLSPYVSAVLVDPEYGFFPTLKYIPKDTGVILSVEKTGYEISGEDRYSYLLEEDIVSKAKRWGVDAIKLLIYWNKEASDECKNHQVNLVRKVGEECYENDLTFILEVLTYNNKYDKKSQEYKKQLPFNIIDAVSTFSVPEFKVDLFKLEAPVNYYDIGVLFTEKDLQNLFTEFNGSLNGIPWVVLSGGVGSKEFAKTLNICCENGASGFLAGRAIWKECVNFVLEQEKMEDHLRYKGLNNLMKIVEASKNSLPFFETRSFKGFENIEVTDINL